MTEPIDAIRPKMYLTTRVMFFFKRVDTLFLHAELQFFSEKTAQEILLGNEKKTLKTTYIICLHYFRFKLLL